jgi:hypothetical protein
MANQIIIDIGAVANDGTGDPLRTAFGFVNNNFSNVWATGVANSNIAFDGNRLLTTNTNGNLILAPNGIGKVQANVDIVPSANNAQSLGSLTRQWNTVYAQNLSVGGNVTFGELTVSGNLTVTGNTIQIGNIVTDTKTIQLANTASTANTANGSGITVGANDNIATFLYNSLSNTWVTNVGITVPSIGNIAVVGANIQLASGVNNNDIFIAPSGALANAYVRIPNNATSLANGLAVVNRYGHVEIQAKDGADVQSWYFREDGSFELPGNVSAHIKSDQDIIIQTGSGDHWTFGLDNILTVPGDIIPDTSNAYSLGNATNQWADLWVSNATIYMNSVPITLGAGNVLTVAGEPVLTNDSTTSISTTGNITADYFFGDGSQLTGLSTSSISNGASNVEIAATNGNVTVTANTQTWTFATDGTTILPTLTVTRGDRTGTLTGQALLFGDITQEAIISTLNGNTDIPNSQRLVINPGAGADGTTGEGGDIYLYAGRGGDAGGSGGDIKIRGGLGPVNGAGGYITMEGGEADVNGVGGYIEIYGGQSGNSNGGYLDLRGGLGQTEGGAVFIQGGQGQAGPGGPVNITGGVSGLGLAEYGNVGVIAGASGWVFDNTGNLTLPQGGVVHETNIPSGGLTGNTIALKPSGGTNADQQLLVYPTAGADFNHLHLTTGNLWNTEMFLGNDDFYVKLANTGNVVINSNDGNSNTAQWTFGTAGTILNSGNLTLQTPSGIPTSLSNWQGQGGWNQAFYSNVATTGGTGTGLTVDVAAAGAGYISINDITINTPGTGYTNGDVITIDNENNLPGTFTVGVVINDWTFDNTGVLTLPGEGVLQSLDDTVTLRSLNTTTGNANSVYLGSSGGLGFNDQEAGGNWLEIFRNGAEPEIRVPVGRGNLNIQTAEGINAYNWTFDNTGNLTLPGNTFAVNYANGTAVALGSGSSYGDSNVVSLLSSFGSNTISTTGNITAGNISGNISITGNITGTSPNVTLVAGSYSTTFDNTGNVTFANSNVFVGTTNTVLPNTVASFSSNVNSYTQVTNQNKSSGADATADFILTANNGNDTVNYGDFGIINSGYDNGTPTNSLGNIVFAADTYLYAQGNVGNTSQSGGNLVIGTTTAAKTVKIFAGGANSNSLVANISSTGVAVTGNVVTSNQLQSSAYTGGNISWAANNRVDFQGAIKVGGTGQILSPGGAASITLNNNGANIPILGVTNTGVSTSTTTGALIVSGGTGIAGNVYVGGLGNITGNLTVNGTGGVSTPNLPAFRVYGNGVTAGLTTTTNTTGILNGNNWAVDYNQGSYLNSTTGLFTAPVAGLYQVNLVARCANNAAPTAQVMVVKNYGSANITQAMWEVAANTTVNHFGVSTVSKLAVGDTLAVRITVGTINFDENDNWSVAFLG